MWISFTARAVERIVGKTTSGSHSFQALPSFTKNRVEQPCHEGCHNDENDKFCRPSQKIFSHFDLLDFKG